MRPGSVFVDVSIDQGGMGETSRPTSHSDPVYVEEGIIHYCVPNIPGSVPATSTIALTNVTLPYCIMLASGPGEALRSDPGLAMGANTWDGHITCEPVAKALGREWREIGSVIRDP
jgi:alanine dehydrogenase